MDELVFELSANVTYEPGFNFPLTVNVSAGGLKFRLWVDVPEPQRLGILLADVPFEAP